MCREVLGKGRYLQLVSEDSWEFVERVGAAGVVAILAITEDGRLVLTEQFRKPVQANVIDLPAGLVGDEAEATQETFEKAALRELLEETGYRATELRELAVGPSSAGLTSELITFFQANGLQKVSDGGGVGGERICVHEVPLDELAQWVRDQQQANKLVDPKIYAALFLAGLTGYRH